MRDKEYNKAKIEYEKSFAKAQEAFDKKMAGAPAMKLMAKQSPERQEFLDRAEAAFAAIEGPARTKFDAEFPE